MYAIWRHAPAVSPDRPQRSVLSVMAQKLALAISLMVAHGTRRRVPGDRWGGLMVAAQSGDDAAYNRLLAEVAAWLHRYYERRLPPSHVDDVVQEALVAIHLKRHTYEPERPFRAWMAGIARYKWIDRLRSIEHERVYPIEEVDVPIKDHESTVTSFLDIRKLLIQLKPAQAEVIRLVKLEGFSIREAAAATGQSTALVKINIHRGIARLASTIDSDEDIA